MSEDISRKLRRSLQIVTIFCTFYVTERIVTLFCDHKQKVTVPHCPLQLRVQIVQYLFLAPTGAQEVTLCVCVRV